MAKIYGLFGAMTGKLSDTVMAVRGGEQIVRKYQPVVANPKTTAQVEARAKLKMLSQMSAVFAPIIAMPKNGNVSARNIFTKENYPLVGFEDDTATIDLVSVKITRGVVALPDLAAATEVGGVRFSLSEYATGSVDRVVYAVFTKQADGTLRLYNSTVISTPGEDGRFAYSMQVGTGRTYVTYAYGVRDNTAAARAIFGNLEVPQAEDIAKLVTSRQLTEADVTLTESKAIQFAHTA